MVSAATGGGPSEGERLGFSPTKAGLIQSGRPQADQIEVTIIGPGYGECILVHIGGGKWIVVDSCVDSEAKKVLPLAYLKELGVDCANDVVMLIATHWHDDHVRGISSLLESFRNADFVLSSAMTREEFATQVVALNSGYTSGGGSGLREADAVLRQMVADREAGSPRHYRRAGRNRRLAAWLGTDFPHGCEVEVWTLSPSDAEFDLFLAELQHLLNEIPRAVGRMPTLRPNNCSVVTWIRIGPLAILLGGDLEDSLLPDCGWTAIAMDSMRPQGRADILKIPHHGSANAHCDLVWTNLVHPNPHAAVTPYNRGRHSLPTAADISRIMRHTDRAISRHGMLPVAHAVAAHPWSGPFAKWGQESRQSRRMPGESPTVFAPARMIDSGKSKHPLML